MHSIVVMIDVATASIAIVETWLVTETHLSSDTRFTKHVELHCLQLLIRIEFRQHICLLVEAHVYSGRMHLVRPADLRNIFRREDHLKNTAAPLAIVFDLRHAIVDHNFGRSFRASSPCPPAVTPSPTVEPTPSPTGKYVVMLVPLKIALTTTLTTFLRPVLMFNKNI